MRNLESNVRNPEFDDLPDELLRIIIPLYLNEADMQQVCSVNQRTKAVVSEYYDYDNKAQFKPSSVKELALFLRHVRREPSVLSVIDLSDLNVLVTDDHLNGLASKTGGRNELRVELEEDEPEHGQCGPTELILQGCTSVTEPAIRNFINSRPKTFTTLNIAGCTQLNAEEIKGLLRDFSIGYLNLSGLELSSEELQDILCSEKEGEFYHLILDNTGITRPHLLEIINANPGRMEISLYNCREFMDMGENAFNLFLSGISEEVTINVDNGCFKGTRAAQQMLGQGGIAM